jgi:hypothetical protein
VHADASVDAERPREHRSRESSREGSRGGRKPNRGREPRQANGARPGRSQPANAQAPRPPQAKPVAAERPPSIGRPEPRRVAREADSEAADHSHLPAFLLRPVRAPV